MDKTMQNLVWSLIPKEFKEEVMEIYKVANQGYEYPASDADKINSIGAMQALEALFGKHNLTSDAEEEEILMVPRKNIVELYQEVQKTISQCKGTALSIQSVGIKNVLWSFFGSKCLPDKNEQILSNVEKTGKNFNVDSLDYNVDSLVPKYKVGDKVVCLNYPDVWRQVTGIMEDGTYVLDNCIYDIKESDIIPYTELGNHKSGGDLSKNSTENCDNENTISICENKESYIKTCTGEKLEDHTAQDLEMVNPNNESLVSKKMRLEIAVKMAQAILSNPNDEMVGLNGKSIVDLAITITDALIAECKK